MQGRQCYCCGAGAPQAATCQQPPKQGYSLQEGRGSGGNSTPEMDEVGPCRGMRGRKGGHQAKGALPASNTRGIFCKASCGGQCVHHQCRSALRCLCQHCQVYFAVKPQHLSSSVFTSTITRVWLNGERTEPWRIPGGSCSLHQVAHPQHPQPQSPPPAGTITHTRAGLAGNQYELCRTGPAPGTPCQPRCCGMHPCPPVPGDLILFFPQISAQGSKPVYFLLYNIEVAPSLHP